ncbi:hypothetical protein ACSQ67_013381 [Phaseolus vulgaris]
MGREEKKVRRMIQKKKAAERERREEEDRLNDPEEQRRIQLLEQEEADRMQRDTILFQEREKAFMDIIITRQQQEQQQQEREEEEEQEQNIDQDHEFEYEDGPPEIIWQGNEIIFKKKQLRVRVTDTHHDHNRPTSNPLPPESSVSESESESRTQTLQDVAQQIPNFGTEQDKAHCPFHLKTGACRFGMRCSRVHFYPDKSSTILIKNMYNGPGLACDRDQDEGLEYTDEEVERCFEEFYEDVHTEFLKFGEIANFKVFFYCHFPAMPDLCQCGPVLYSLPILVPTLTIRVNHHLSGYLGLWVGQIVCTWLARRAGLMWHLRICDNHCHAKFLKLKLSSSNFRISRMELLTDLRVCKNGSFHLRGNVYVQYKALDSALLAYNLVNGRYFAGKQVTCQFVNLTRWKVAICGEYMKSGFKTCSHGTACNFIHCFRNPGGDYEWADSDKPPPKFWVEKIIALFGYSDYYETSREQGNLSLSKTDSDRYHCTRSRSREMDKISCGHSGRRKHEDERKQRTPNEDRNASFRNTHKRKSRGRTPDTDSDREWLEKEKNRERRHEYTHKRKSLGRTPDTDSDREWLEKEENRERRHEYTRNGSFNKNRDDNSGSHEEDSDVDCDTRDNEKQHGRDVRRHRISESSRHQSGDASESDKDLFGRVAMETVHDYSRKSSRHRRSDVYKKKRSK